MYIGYRVESLRLKRYPCTQLASKEGLTREGDRASHIATSYTTTCNGAGLQVGLYIRGFIGFRV